MQRRAYKVRSWTDAEDFLTKLAQASGKLMRGGEPDLNTAAKMVLYDWQRGKIPFFKLPPDYTPDTPAAAGPSADVAADVTASSAPAYSAVAGPSDEQVGDPLMIPIHCHPCISFVWTGPLGLFKTC